MEVKAMRIKSINGKPYVKKSIANSVYGRTAQKQPSDKPSIGIMKHNEAVYNAAEEIINRCAKIEDLACALIMQSKNNDVTATLADSNAIQDAIENLYFIALILADMPDNSKQEIKLKGE